MNSVKYKAEIRGVDSFAVWKFVDGGKWHSAKIYETKTRGEYFLVNGKRFHIGPFDYFAGEYDGFHIK